jgi:hypothetical protein
MPEYLEQDAHRSLVLSEVNFYAQLREHDFKFLYIQPLNISTEKKLMEVIDAMGDEE